MDYRTTDIVLAATLMYYNAQLKDIELNERQGVFILVNVIDHDVEHFKHGRLLVDPYLFNLKLRYLHNEVRKKLSYAPD